MYIFGIIVKSNFYLIGRSWEFIYNIDDKMKFPKFDSKFDSAFYLLGIRMKM